MSILKSSKQQCTCTSPAGKLRPGLVQGHSHGLRTSHNPTNAPCTCPQTRVYPCKSQYAGVPPIHPCKPCTPLQVYSRTPPCTGPCMLRMCLLHLLSTMPIQRERRCGRRDRSCQRAWACLLQIHRVEGVYKRLTQGYSG